MIQSKNYKRQTRQLSDRQKQLISQKLKGAQKNLAACRTNQYGHEEYVESEKTSIFRFY